MRLSSCQSVLLVRCKQKRREKRILVDFNKSSLRQHVRTHIQTETGGGLISGSHTKHGLSRAEYPSPLTEPPNLKRKLVIIWYGWVVMKRTADASKSAVDDFAERNENNCSVETGPGKTMPKVCNLQLWVFFSRNRTSFYSSSQLLWYNLLHATTPTILDGCSRPPPRGKGWYSLSKSSSSGNTVERRE